MITALINALEEYRLDELKKRVKTGEREPMNVARHKEEAMEFLKRPDLPEKTNELIDSSRMGKSHLQEKIGKLMAGENKVGITALS